VTDCSLALHCLPLLPLLFPQVYKISGGQIRPSRVTAWDPSGDLELQVGSDTAISEVEDDGSVPRHCLSVAPFARLPDRLARIKADGSAAGGAQTGTVDIIGIVSRTAGAIELDLCLLGARKNEVRCSSAG